MSVASTASQITFGDRLLRGAQALGRALMLPIAVLPVAALLLRLGQSDIWAWTHNAYLTANGIPFLAQAGDTILDNPPINLAMIFAVGIAYGLTSDGAAAIAGLVGYLVFIAVFGTMIPQLAGKPDIAHYNMGVFGGIIIGAVAAWLYKRFHDIRLPDYLAFFGGRRFIPIITGVTAVILGLIFGWIWPTVQGWINDVGTGIIGFGPFGPAIYGVLNRLLIPLGLHHVLNSYVWFQLGTYKGTTGDLSRYFAGDPTAGNWMAGFFPVMMFGLPGAALAMVRRAKFSKVAAGILLSAAFCSFLTGVTEPIEFAFIFVAPVLFVVHALLTGLSLLICNLLQIRIGFGFSAGLFDYLLNFSKANSNNAWMILPLGAIYFAVYYFLFSFCIKFFNIGTPGRGEERTGLSADWILPESQRGPKPSKNGKTAVAEGAEDADTVLAAQVLEALGNRANVESVEGCITRLRLFVKEPEQVDDARLKSLGAAGVIKRGKIVQVVMGTQSDRIAERIKRLMKEGAETVSD